MRLLIIALTVLAPLCAHGATYYKWVDHNGVVQYTTTPPPKGQQSTTVKTHAQPARTETPPSDAETPAATTDPDAPSAAQVAEAKRRQEACAAARTNLTVLANPKVTRLDPDSGQQVELSNEEIMAERTRNNEVIVANCDAG